MSKTHALRELYSSAVQATGLVARRREAPGERVTIITYHNISAEPFARHVAWLTKNYRIISLDEAVNGLLREAPLPAKALAITFDDGYRSFYSDAFPVLRQHHAPATVFLTTGYIGADDVLWFDWVDLALRAGLHARDCLPPALRKTKPAGLIRPLMRYLKAAPDAERESIVQGLRRSADLRQAPLERYRLLGWEQVREMQDSGLISFGGHTQTHPILTKVSAERARQEIAGCAADLERALGPATRHFAYPNGEKADFDRSLAEMVRKAGFRSAVTAVSGVCAPGDDAYTLHRVGLDGSFSLTELAVKLSGLWISLRRGTE